MKKMKKKLLLGAIILFVGIYATHVYSIYSYRYLEYKPGHYGPLVVGDYTRIDPVRIQMPMVLAKPGMALIQGEDSQMRFTNEGAVPLDIVEGEDAWYFDQEMRQTGARILPGLSRFWAEGRVTAFEDKLDFHGYTLEKGLTLFVIPFSRVISWQVTLERQIEVTEGTD